MLGFLEKMTLHPGDLSSADIVTLRQAKLSKEAIQQAIYIAAFFNIIDRIADTLDFEVFSPENFAHRAALTLQRGYRFSQP